MTLSTIIGYVAILLIGVAVFAVAFSQLMSAGGFVGQHWPRYEARLQRQARFLFLKITGTRIARIQAAIGGALLFVGCLPEMRGLLLFLPIVALVPDMVLAHLCQKRRLEIDLQLPLWLLALANALKASPSIGEALSSSTPLVPKPLQDELELTLKEFQLGAPIDHALRNMRERINTRNFSAAISTVLVARETGGDLPKILEESSAALREMDRLEGVLRTKTAEGKAQAYLMGILPFVICAALHYIDPLWLPTLTKSITGYAILVSAVLLWVGSIIVTRKVLAVDL
jgi:tight adherence protein B